MSAPEVKRAAIYVRQSVNHQEGIDRALARTREEVSKRGWTLVGEYADNAVSATKSRVSGTRWADLLADLAKGGIDVVVGVDLDRLVRSIQDLGKLIDSGVKVLTVDGEIDLTTADGEFRATMLAAIARFEVRRKSERQKRANAYRVSIGLPVAGGRRRFGFKADHLTVIPEEAEWVRYMHKRLTEGASVRSIARDLNDAGVPCVTKGVWNAARILKILRNPAYRGYVIHKKKAWPSEAVEVIVAPEVSSVVDVILADPTRLKNPGNDRSALLGGIAYCGTCQAPLISAGTKNKGQLVKTYACSAVKNGSAAAKSHPSIRRAILDQEVMEEVFHWVVEHPDAEAVEESALLSSLIAELAETNRQRLAAQELALLPGALVSEVAKTLAKLGKRAEKLSAEIEAERSNLVRNGVLEQVRKHWWDRRGVAEFTELEEKAWDEWPAYWAGLGLDRQRELVTGLFQVVVKPGRGLERVDIEWLS